MAPTKPAKQTKSPVKEKKKGTKDNVSTSIKGKEKAKSSPAKNAAPLATQEENGQEEVEEDAQDESGDEDDSNDESGGVDEKGMERLMKALGEDGLNEFDQAMLEDDEEDDEDEDEDDEDGSVAEGSDEDEDEEVGAGMSDDSEGEDNEEEEELVALDHEDMDLLLEPDAVPQQKLEIDNEAAMSRIRETIQLDPSIPWTETLVLSYPQTIDVDVNDDLNRELAFYKQALHSAEEARKLAQKHKFPFTRPADYFAEMVKSDSHMERIRQRLLDESAGIKKSEEKRREREGKKFGKQVQIAKLKEREQNKKDMEERLKGLKRKRKDILENGGDKGNDDDFDVAVEDAIADRPSKRSKGGDGKRGLSRQSRDKKFGFGGQGRRSKQNTKESTDNFEMSGNRRGGFRGGRGGGSRGGGRGGRGGGRGGGSSRPGKSKRMAARSK